MTKITILGAGNKGGAIATALCPVESFDLTVANRSAGRLDALGESCRRLVATTDMNKAVVGAHYIIFAVKPWAMRDVIDQVKNSIDYERQVVISIAGGVGLDALDAMLDKDGALPAVFHVIPDTAVSVKHGMTFVSCRRANDTMMHCVNQIFELMGDVAFIDEHLMDAATALSSCGIAYAYKYVQACVQAGVQLGFTPSDSLRYVLSTIDGAVSMLRENGTLPQQEIDRVTTPGGMTIKGVNELERGGFTSTVIDAILKPLQK